jgi:hypothetical protein
MDLFLELHFVLDLFYLCYFDFRLKSHTSSSFFHIHNVHPHCILHSLIRISVVGLFGFDDAFMGC